MKITNFQAGWKTPTVQGDNTTVHLTFNVFLEDQKQLNSEMPGQTSAKYTRVSDEVELLCVYAVPASRSFSLFSTQPSMSSMVWS